MATATKKAPVKKKSGKPVKKPVKKAAPVQGGKKAGTAEVKDARVLAREILYPEVTVRLFQGDTPMTEAEAKKLLGWEEETEQIKFGSDYLLTDSDGKKIRCYHNIDNRPYDKNQSRTLESEILNRRWKLNGETWIVGQTGKNISMQHRAIGLVLAVQEWKKNPDKWPLWETEPTMECIVVFGIDESDEVIDTIDTGKPRSLTDVIFRSELFRDVKASQRKEMSKMASFAIKTVADRTGAWVNAFSPKRTHSEMIDFLNRHSRLLECVKHIYEETTPDGEDKNRSPLVAAGTASGLMYLMACSTTNPADYIPNEDRMESQLNFDNWDKAEEFWINVANRKYKSLINVFGTFIKDSQSEDEESETAGGTPAEKVATIIKAWKLFVDRKPITEEGLKLTYHVEDGVKTLAECPTVGGVDCGNPKDSTDVVPPTPAELQERKAEIDKAAQEAKATPVKKATKKKGAIASSNGKIKEGDIAYVVVDPEAGVWYGGQVMEIFPVQGGKVKARLNLTLPKAMKDKTEEVEYHLLTSTKPE